MTPRLLTLKTHTADDFEALLESLPAEQLVPLEQSALWDRMLGSDPARTRYGFFSFWDDDDAPVAVLALERIRRRFRESLVALAGPVFVAEQTAERERELVAALRAHLEQDSAVSPHYLRITLKHPEAVRGAVPSIERGYFEREVVVPLAGTPEDLKKTFSSTTRNLINRGRRTGIEPRLITEDREAFFAEHCFPILEETAARGEFDLLPLSYYQSLLRAFPEHTGLYAAYAPVDAGEKELVCWLVTNEYHFRGCYWFAGSTERAQKINAMPVLLNRMLLDMRESGMLACGLTGISSPRYPELKRLERFKLSFSKTIEERGSLHDIPLRPIAYRGLRTAITARREGPAIARRTLARVKDSAQRVIKRPPAS
jgi:hypothetical protein